MKKTMKNLMTLMNLIKYVVFISAGLVPALVFKIYAQPEDTYDALFSIIVWVSLALIDTNKFQEEKKMSGLTITCCEFCNKWFDVEDKRCSVFDFANAEALYFCPECGERLIQCINKMKKEIYGHKEETNEEQTKR